MRIIRYLLAAIFIGIALWFIYQNLTPSLKDIPSLFKEANKQLVLLVLAFQALAYFGDGWLSKIILEMGGFRIRVGNTIRVAILGVVGSQTIPVFGGTALTYHLYRKLGAPLKTAVFLIIVWTFFVWSIYFLSLIPALFFIPKSYFFLLSPENTSMIVAVLLIICYFLFKKRGEYLVKLGIFLSRIINNISLLFVKRRLIRPEKIKIFIDEFFKDLSIAGRSKIKIVQALIASLIFYGGSLASLYASFLVFGFKPDLGLLVLGYVLSWILALLILIPEMPGVIEASLVAVFIGLGFPAHISLFATLLFRLFSYWLPLPLGIFSYWRLKREFAIK